MTRQVKDIIDNKSHEAIYPTAHAQATFMSNGATVEDAINDIKNNTDNIDLSGYATINNIDGKNCVRVEGITTSQFVYALPYDSWGGEDVVLASKDDITNAIEDSNKYYVTPFTLYDIYEANDLQGETGSFQFQISDPVTTAEELLDALASRKIIYIPYGGGINGGSIALGAFAEDLIYIRVYDEYNNFGLLSLDINIDGSGYDCTVYPGQFIMTQTLQSNINNCNTNKVLNERISTSFNGSIDANRYYRFTNPMATLNISSFGSTYISANHLNEYFVEFSVASGGTVTFPSTVKWVDGVVPTFETGYVYQVSITVGKSGTSTIYLGTYTKFK